jgi:hypothetical protein
VFPKSADAQKIKEKFIRNQVWAPQGFDTYNYHCRLEANQINRGPNIVQITEDEQAGEDD